MATGDVKGLQEVAGPAFTEVNLKTVFTGRSTVTHTIAADGDTVITGDEFTPALTTEPFDVSVWLAGIKQQVNISWAFNTPYYDITISTTEALTNAKINVLL